MRKRVLFVTHSVTIWIPE